MKLWLTAVLAACAGVVAAAEQPARVDFRRDVQPILREHCVSCHGPELQMNGLRLDRRADAMRGGSQADIGPGNAGGSRLYHRLIGTNFGMQMPPAGPLSDEQIDTIVGWVDAGAPQGDPKDMPPPRQWNDNNEWKGMKDLGPPDLVVKSEPYTMVPNHQDVWWRPLTNIPLTEPRWLRAVEIRPGTLKGRRITHHAVAYLVQEDPDGVAPGTDSALNARAYLMEWAVGKGYDLHGPDAGKLLLPGSQISWDVHLHAVGEEIRDNVEIALWLYPKGQEPKHRTYLTGFQALRGFQTSKAAGATRNVDIPPNTIASSDNFTVLPKAARLENFQPHMHLRGKAMAVEAILPDGSVQTVSYVGRFNFNWMTNYIYDDDAAPVFPKGTVIHVTAWYDNTSANPNNPDPEQWVGFGDRTVDEMGHAWMNVTYLSDEEYESWAAKHKTR